MSPVRKVLLAAALVAAAVCPCLARAAAAQCTLLPVGAPAAGSSIGFLADASLPPRVLAAALAAWRRCANHGVGFPALTGDGAGGRAITVRHVANRAGDGRCGSFAGSGIVLYATQRLADGRVVPCGALSQNLAHEIGHVLGLDDAPEEPSCQFHIMSLINGHNRLVRRVQPEECMVVGQRWLTFGELAEAETLPAGDVAAYVAAAY